MSLKELVAAWGPHLLLIAALAVPWGILLNSLRVDWTVNAQYAYGWAVPALCLYLLARRFEASRSSTSLSAPETPRAGVRSGATLSRGWVLGGLCVFLVLWFLTRFIQEANPDWRLVTWAQALEVIGLTLLMLRGYYGFSKAAFPLLFFLVAVPWPSLLEIPLLQHLARANADLAVDALSLVGLPALQHGNTIELATGVLGIDDACSGIRSFQASLMLSLFFGEFARLTLAGRVLLVAAGFALAFASNVLRTTLLACVAAAKGIPAVSRWHDPAGILILLACFTGLLLLARALRKLPPTAASPPHAPALLEPGEIPLQRQIAHLRPLIPPRRANARSAKPLHIPHRSISLFLLVGLGLSEIAVELWYRLHESSLPPRQSWTFQPPAAAQNLVQLSLPEKSRQILRFTRAAAWRWDDGPLRWQAAFLEWKPGRVTPQLARFHNPEVCLSASGTPHQTLLDSASYQVHRLRLPFRVLRSASTPHAPPQFLFYTIWEDRSPAQQLLADTIDYPSRFLRACRGQRNLGLRALDISLQGVDDLPTAEALFQQQLNQILLRGEDRRIKERRGKTGKGRMIRAE